MIIIIDKNNIKIISSLFFILLLPIYISYQISEISIKINKTGSQQILSYRFLYLPSLIIINDVIQNLAKREYNLVNKFNIIKIKWNYSLTNCDYMFSGLSNIIEIDLSKFNSSSITSMKNMFYNCTSLEVLNLNNFDTTKVSNMAHMFHGCNSLRSLNINSFDTSQVINMYAMFSYCDSLISLNLNNFDTSKVTNMAYMFYECDSLRSLNLNNFDTSKVTNMEFMFFKCNSLSSLNLNNFDTSQVINMDAMFSYCDSLLALNLNNLNLTKVSNFQFMFYNSISLVSLYINNLIISNFQQLESLFKEFNKDLLLCIKNQTGIQEKDELPYFNNNCSDICFIDSRKFIPNEKRCVLNCKESQIYKFEYNNICYENDTFLNNDKNYFSFENIFNINFQKNSTSNPSINDEIINIIKTNIINDNLDLSNLIEGDKEDLMFKTQNILYQITTTENQKKNEYNNITTIDFGECENIIKPYYNLTQNQSLIILKIEYNKSDSLIPIIGYELFHPITKKSLNLTYCKNTTINLNIPVILNEDNLFKYDPNSEYYTDECNSYTTENNTDIILKDRHNEYNKNNMSICENICEFKGYKVDKKKANCSCAIKFTQISIESINNDDNIFWYNFKEKEESSNMNTMKCINKLFTKEGISENIASYVMIFIITLFLISGVLFYKCGYNILEYSIQEIIQLKENEKKKINKNYKETDNNPELKVKKIIKKNTKKGKKRKINSKINNQLAKSIGNNSKSFSKFNINNKNSIFKKIIIYDDYELNSLSHNEALKYDKRKYINYYISLLLVKHPIIFSFYPKKDYNSMIIKIDLFFFSFSIYYFTNALFFVESTIHKIYEEGGIYNFIFLIPFISYSFLISHILTIFIKYFSLSERNLYEIKNEKSFKKVYDKVSDVKRCLIIKYILFYVIGSLILMFFWYYLSSFGAVYQNTQIYLIKNTLISFCFSLIYPFIINLIPGMFRFYSLKGETRKRKCFYKISKIIQFI